MRLSYCARRFGRLRACLHDEGPVIIARSAVDRFLQAQREARERDSAFAACSTIGALITFVSMSGYMGPPSRKCLQRAERPADALTKRTLADAAALPLVCQRLFKVKTSILVEFRATWQVRGIAIAFLSAGARWVHSSVSATGLKLA
jgi:hypothetical protein